VAGRREIVLVDASLDGTADEAAGLFTDLRILRMPAGLLAPELWSAGLRAVETPFIAFSTAQMAPLPGWLDALLDGIGGYEAAGGPIAPATSLSPTDRALYLLRYANDLPSFPADHTVDPPGDNALYRRDTLMDVESAWGAGFWEVEVHRRLREGGGRTRMALDAVVEFLGGVQFGGALRQRVAHARHYAGDRARGRGIPHRLARTAIAPLVPALLSWRIARNLRRRGMDPGPWLTAAPRLALLATARSLGELRGTWSGRPRGRTT